jgi:hypothetical protein
METNKSGVTVVPPGEGKMLWVTDEPMALKRRAKTPAGLTLSLTH